MGFVKKKLEMAMFIRSMWSYLITAIKPLDLLLDAGNEHQVPGEDLPEDPGLHYPDDPRHGLRNFAEFFGFCFRKVSFPSEVV